jgi:hypothetical protein
VLGPERLGLAHRVEAAGGDDPGGGREERRRRVDIDLLDPGRQPDRPTGRDDDHPRRDRLDPPRLVGVGDEVRDLAGRPGVDDQPERAAIGGQALDQPRRRLGRAGWRVGQRQRQDIARPAPEPALVRLVERFEPVGQRQRRRLAGDLTPVLIPAQQAGQMIDRQPGRQRQIAPFADDAGREGVQIDRAGREPVERRPQPMSIGARVGRQREWHGQHLDLAGHAAVAGVRRSRQNHRRLVDLDGVQEGPRPRQVTQAAAHRIVEDHPPTPIGRDRLRGGSSPDRGGCRHDTPGRRDGPQDA